MKNYLLNTFKYNDAANRKLLSSILELPAKEEAVRLFSHLITAQDKWFNRVVKTADDNEFDWASPVFSAVSLEKEWDRSITNWINLVRGSTEEELHRYIEFVRQSDNKLMRVRLSDIMLQLNYHSIHHRAQINTLISKQGQKPPVTDYIFTVLEEA